MSFLRFCFSFSGRMNRREYASMYFGSMFALVAGIALAVGLLKALGGGGDNPIVIIFACGLLVGCKWATLAALAKRLHDVGASGGLCLLAFIPALGFVFFLVMLFVPGTKGDNHFGAPTSFFKPRMSYAGA